MPTSAPETAMPADQTTTPTSGFWAGHKSLEGKPLNGEKTHPLTAHAQGVLRDLLRGPIPRQVINPGVMNRLEREGLTEEVMLPSPFRNHQGKPLRHAQITAAGRKAISNGQ